jgi:hypothetical protein
MGMCQYWSGTLSLDSYQATECTSGKLRTAARPTLCDLRHVTLDKQRPLFGSPILELSAMEAKLTNTTKPPRKVYAK